MQEMKEQTTQMFAEHTEQHEETTCCIVGAGPAGAILALLLARQGVEVTLLEEHQDFARDFRGDTVHPSTMDVLEQIGLAERLLQLKHSKVGILAVKTEQGASIEVNFKRLKTRYPYVTLLPQVHFLEFLMQEAERYANFHLVLGARAEKLIEEDGYIHGVHYRARDGWHELRAVLTVGADGRFSRIRKLANFEPIKSSPPMDILWFRLPRQEGDPFESGFMLGKGHIALQLDRNDEWQIGYIIAKGGYQAIKTAGLELLRSDIARLFPYLTERLQALTDWKQVSVLAVESSMVKRWYRPGLLVIGDAAHVMSPVGGVGINYAIQDAVATANLMTENLQKGQVPTEDLARVQRRREWPTRLIQSFQSVVQKQFLARVLNSEQPMTIPFPVKVFLSTPILRDLPGKLIGFGPRREHVKYVTATVRPIESRETSLVDIS